MDHAEIEAEYRRRAKTEHPDMGGSAERFAALLAWRDKQLNPQVVDLGDGLHMTYIRHHSIGGMEIYVGISSVVYVLPPELDKVQDWPFANDKMKKEMQKYLPELVRKKRNIQIYRRKPTQVLMLDLVTPLEPQHVAWMVSRMMNLACYLSWAELSHCAISPEFLLVDLETHGVALTGPASYVTKMGVRPEAVPARTFGIVPSLGNKATVATPKIDLSLVRSTAMTLMGERNKAPFRQWLLSPPAATAFKDLEGWSNALGKRTFVKFPTTAKEIYNG